MSRVRGIGIGLLLSASLIPLWSTPAGAEPAFAVRTGYTCSQCHTNRTGGGLRTAFGSMYTQTILPARLLTFGDGGNLLPANPNARLGYGADARFQYLYLESEARQCPTP